MTSQPTTASISCTNSQGDSLSATVLTLKRYSVVFEVYNPFSIVQVSELLQDFRIFAEEKLIYAGRATVSSLVNTGMFVLCEAVLEDAWVKLDSIERQTSEGFATQLRGFFNEWEESNQVVPSVREVVSDTELFLVGMQKWFGKIDLGIRTSYERDRGEWEREIFQDIRGEVVSRFHPLVLSFVEAAKDIEPEKAAMHKYYIRRRLHPLVLCSPFLYRAYAKPLGYAGDYEMVNMILQQDYAGSSAFAKIINHTFLQSPPAVAHRNRIHYLTDLITKKAAMAVKDGKRLRVYNLGCGPAEEVLRVIQQENLSDHIDFTLVDFNSETLEYTKGRLAEAIRIGGRRAKLTFVQRSVNQILKTASKGAVTDQYDLVYCAGLFDYLSQKVCQKMVQLFTLMALPGGSVAVTNVSSRNPVQSWMEYLMEWSLIHRNDEEMMDLTPKFLPEGCANLKQDATGVNVFLEINKPIE